MAIEQKFNTDWSDENAEFTSERMSALVHCMQFCCILVCKFSYLGPIKVTPVVTCIGSARRTAPVRTR